MRSKKLLVLTSNHCFRAKMQGLCGVTKSSCLNQERNMHRWHKWLQVKTVQISVDVDPASACVRQLIISHWFLIIVHKVELCHFANGCYHSHRLRMPTLSETEWLPVTLSPIYKVRQPPAPESHPPCAAFTRPQFIYHLPSSPLKVG